MGVEIKKCEAFEVDELLLFIDREWKKGHIFTKDRELFDWQHKNEIDYNFILAKENDEIIGILGYIPTSKYSPILKEHNDIWLAIWKVKDNVNKPGLGIMLLNFLRRHLDNPNICSLGLSQEVIPIYKALKYQVGTLSHRAFFNQDIKKFNICNPGENYKIKINIDSLRYEICSDIKFLEDQKCDLMFSCHPKKNKEYLENRYLKHPRYKYKICYIYNDGNLLSFFVYRVIKIEGVYIARVVDAFGESITNNKFNNVISKFVSKNSYEYLDIVSNQSCDMNSGFLKSDSKVIIPNYFEPFVQNNVNIDFAYKNNYSGFFTIHRGDSDQDRPNL